MGTVQTTSRPSRRKNRSGSTWNWTTTSPLPFAPWPLRRMRVPSSVPGGTVMIKRFSTRTSPAPWQVPHRVEGTRPLPRHTGHGRLTAKPPCPKEIVPRPLHSGQTEMVAPGAAPLPPHVGHTSAIGSVTGTLPPSAATRNGIETVASTSSSASSIRPSPRFPKIEENRSPSPPNEPRSDRAKSMPESPPAPPLPRPPPHACGSDARSPQLLAGLQHRAHRVVLLGRRRGRRGHGFVLARIERHPDLIHPSHASRLELLPDLALHEIDSLVDRLRRLGAGLDVREAGEVVQCVHETLPQVRLSLRPQLSTLLERALAEVVVLGGEPKVCVLGHHLRRCRDRRFGCKVANRRRGGTLSRILGCGTWLLGRSRPLGFIVHGAPRSSNEHAARCTPF